MRLRYWINTGLRSLGLLLGVSLLYYIFMALQMPDGWDGIMTILPIYLLLFGAMMVLGMSLGLYRFNVSLALSFGSTRGETLLGLQLCRLIPALAVTAVLTLLAGTDGFMALSALIPLSLGLYLGAAAIGSVMGLLYLKWGKLSVVITVVVVLLGAFGIGFLSAFFSDGWISSLTSIDSLGWLALGIGLVLYGLMLIPESRTVWKYNVKL